MYRSEFGTVVHRCACGCGEEVVTPLGPGEWRLTYDGRTVSLAPSIGNWSFACRSHYWIDEGNVRWARGFSAVEVDLVRTKARTRREGYYGTESPETLGQERGKGVPRRSLNDEQGASRRSIWERIRTLRRPWGRGR